MNTRILGQGLAVSSLGLGCMRMSYGDAPIGTEQEMIDFLHQAVERGVTFFDTAEVYGPFTNEIHIRIRSSLQPNLDLILTLMGKCKFRQV